MKQKNIEDTIRAFATKDIFLCCTCCAREKTTTECEAVKERRFEQTHLKRELAKNAAKLQQIGNETNKNKGSILSRNDNCFLQMPGRKCARVYVV